MADILFDLHSHTLFSPDGESGAEEMTLRAMALGVRHFAITDHVEINQFNDGEFDYPDAVEKAAAVIAGLKEKYAGQINLLYGVELGQPLHDRPLAEKVLSGRGYDFIIGSCHMVRGFEDFYFLDYSKNDVDKLLDAYFDELLEMAEWGGFDVLGHLTYPLRYIEGDHGIAVDMSRYAGIIDEIFRALIRNGCGIEINTSGLRQRIGRLLPELQYVKRYRELGGKILTIGSDAHRTDDLGRNIADGIAAAKEAGFDKIAVFRKRKAEFVNI